MNGAVRSQQRLTCRWLAEVGTWNPGALRRLQQRYGGLDALLEHSREDLAAELSSARRAVPAAVPGLPAEEERWTEAGAYAATLAAAARGPVVASVGRPVVTWVDDRYPARLRHLSDPPPALFLAGAAVWEALTVCTAVPVVAVVGTRGPTAYGRDMARAIASGLTKAGVLVVSGLAMGIDAEAHSAALTVAAGTCAVGTAAVLGCGVDVVYPRVNRRLFARVHAAGLLLSEFVWGAGARAWRFPARNRIIAGLADAVVVVEGGARSGALSTAEFCNDLGREPLAVPGEAGRRLSAGPHRLLREGRAGLCESAADVLAALGLPQSASSRQAQLHLAAGAASGDAAAVLSALDGGELRVDELAIAASLRVVDCLATLAELELAGLVSPCSGGRYRLVRGDDPGVVETPRAG